MATAMEHVQVLVDRIGPRPVSTEEENQASQYVAQELIDMGLDVDVDEFATPTGMQWPYTVAFVLSILGIVLSGIAVLLPNMETTLLVLGLLFTVVGWFLYHSEHSGHPLLGRMRTNGISQNVVARYLPESASREKRRRRIVIVAHLDTVRAELAGSPSVVKHVPLFKKLVGYTMPVLVLVALLRLLPLPWPDTVDTVLLVVGIVGAVLVLLATVDIVSHRFMSFASGANDNASGVAVMLAAARRMLDPADRERREAAKQREQGGGEAPDFEAAAEPGDVSDEQDGASLADAPAGQPVSVHSAEEAYAAGVVPDGAELEYAGEGEVLGQAGPDVAGTAVADGPAAAAGFADGAAAVDQSAAAGQQSGAESGVVQEEAALSDTGHPDASAQSAGAVSFAERAARAQARSRAGAGASAAGSAKRSSGLPSWYTAGKKKAAKELAAEGASEENAEDRERVRSRFADVPMEGDTPEDDETMLAEQQVAQFVAAAQAVEQGGAAEPAPADAAGQDLASQQGQDASGAAAAQQPAVAGSDLQDREPQEAAGQDGSPEQETVQQQLAAAQQQSPAVAQQPSAAAQEQRPAGQVLQDASERPGQAAAAPVAAQEPAPAQAAQEASMFVEAEPSAQTTQLQPLEAEQPWMEQSSSFPSISQPEDREEIEASAFSAPAEKPSAEETLVISDEPVLASEADAEAQEAAFEADAAAVYSRADYGEGAEVQYAEEPAGSGEAQDGAREAGFGDAGEGAFEDAADPEAIDAALAQEAEPASETAGVRDVVEAAQSESPVEDTHSFSSMTGQFDAVPAATLETRSAKTVVEEMPTGSFEGISELETVEGFDSPAPAAAEADGLDGEAVEDEPAQERGDAKDSLFKGLSSLIPSIGSSAQTGDERQPKGRSAKQEMASKPKRQLRSQADKRKPSKRKVDDSFTPTAASQDNEREASALSRSRQAAAVSSSYEDTPQGGPASQGTDGAEDDWMGQPLPAIPSMSGRMAAVDAPGASAAPGADMVGAASRTNFPTLTGSFPAIGGETGTIDAGAFEQPAAVFDDGDFALAPAGSKDAADDLFSPQQGAAEFSMEESRFHSAVDGVTSIFGRIGKRRKKKDVDESSFFDQDGEDSAWGGDDMWKGGAYFSDDDLGFDDIAGLSGGSSAAAPSSTGSFGAAAISAARQRAAEIRESVIQMTTNDTVAKEVWFVGLGASAAGNHGMKNFLELHAGELRGALIVNLEGVGAGDICYLGTEGNGSVHRSDRRLQTLVRQAAQNVLGHEARSRKMEWRDTDATPALVAGMRAITLMGMDDTAPVGWHWTTDTLELVDEEQLDDVTDLVLDIIDNA